MLQKDFEFHLILEKHVQDLQYGQITVNVQLKDGKPIIETLSIVKQKRTKYKSLTT